MLDYKRLTEQVVYDSLKIDGFSALEMEILSWF